MDSLRLFLTNKGLWRRKKTLNDLRNINKIKLLCTRIKTYTFYFNLFYTIFGTWYRKIWGLDPNPEPWPYWHLRLDPDYPQILSRIRMIWSLVAAYRDAWLHGGLSHLGILAKLVGRHKVHGEVKLRERKKKHRDINLHHCWQLRSQNNTVWKLPPCRH